MPNLLDVWIVFFITLGPLKVIPVFYMLTQRLDRKAVRGLAVLSTLVATVMVFVIAVFFSAIMTRWKISMEAMRIAGGVLLFVISLKAITQFELMEPLPAEKPGDAGSASSRPAPAPSRGPRWMSKPILSPLVIPTIITPVGVVAILLLMGLAAGDARQIAGLFLLLLFIMALNLLAMLYSGAIMRYVKLPVLQVIGWIMQILMSALAVKVILVALKQLKALP